MCQSKTNKTEYIKERYGSITNYNIQKESNLSESRVVIPLNVISSSLNIGYSEGDLSSIPMTANMGLGCGNPIIAANLEEGEVVLDLGCGGGIDCFLARRKVGESGFVVGVDMTPKMIELANLNKEKAGYKNVDFKLGVIENLPVETNSVDVIISNCVVNLSLDKEQVFKETYRVLKPNGRICLSDIVATADLPQSVREDLASLAGCIAGAEFVEHIHDMLKRIGFSNIKLTPKDNSKQILNTWNPNSNLEEFVASYLIEARKVN